MPFMEQDYSNRLNGTIAQICEMCPAKEQATIRQFLLHWIAQYSRLDRQQFFATFMTKGFLKAGTEKERADRRILALINTNMMGVDCPSAVDLNWVRFSTGAAIAHKLEFFPLRLFALQQQKDMSLLKSELQELLRDPELFLHTRTLVCQPHGIPPAGVHEYLFYFDYEQQQFTISPVGVPGPVWFRGTGIRLKALNVPRLNLAEVPQMEGADILLTCAESGRKAAEQFGARSPKSVIGFRRAGVWEMYAQTILPGGWNEVTAIELGEPAVLPLTAEKSAA